MKHAALGLLIKAASNIRSLKDVRMMIQAGADIIKEQIDCLIPNHKEKKIVFQEVERYLDLILQAQKEGDLEDTLKASIVLKIVEENVWIIALQDKIAAENLMGDHGIRHIDYNISTTENIFNEFEKQGQKVKSIDRLWPIR